VLAGCTTGTDHSRVDAVAEPVGVGSEGHVVAREHYGTGGFSRRRCG
jgi:hypothetical protein